MIIHRLTLMRNLIKKTFLIIDTADSLVNISCYNDKSDSFENFVSTIKNAQNEELCDKVDDILLKNNLKINEIEVFGINIGPGSFTGVRTGMSYISSILQFNKNIGIVKFDTFDMMYFDIYEVMMNEEIGIIIKLSQNDYYLKSYPKCEVLHFTDIDLLNKKISCFDKIFLSNPNNEIIHANKLQINQSSNIGLQRAFMYYYKDMYYIANNEILAPFYLKEHY